MKKRQICKTLAAGLSLAAAPAAFGQFDTAQDWNDGAQDAPFLPAGGPASFLVNGPGTQFEITAGGADFWGNNDRGTSVYNSNGDYTTTGDFLATVQFNHVDVEAAANWGRSGLNARATVGGIPQTLNKPLAATGADAYLQATIRSNGFAVTGWRDARGNGVGRANNGFATGPTSPGEAAPVRIAIARDGDTLRTAFSNDLDGDGTYSPWVQDQARNQAAWAAGTEITVGAFHQAHNEGGRGVNAPVGPSGPGAGRVNTAQFQDFSYTGSYDSSLFHSLATSLSVDENTGAISGTASFNVDGAPSGSFGTNWTVSASNFATFQPTFGPGGKGNYNPGDGNLVPAGNFRYDTGGGVYAPGVEADLYVAQNNAGNLAANDAYIQATAPSGSVVLPNLSWTGGNNNDANYGGLTGPSSFGLAIDPAFDGTAGAFSGNQEQFGVDHYGQMFIEPNGGYQDVLEAGTGGEWVQFKDGVDDYTYLVIDGQVVLDDNNWTNPASTGNGGGNVGLFDASDPKFDDGEWVDFRYITWEGGGGDGGKLFSDMFAAEGDFNFVNTPGTLGAPTELSGSGNVNGSFGGSLAPGTWQVTLSTAGEFGLSAGGASTIVTVVPEPGTLALIGLAGIALIFRRRK